MQQGAGEICACLYAHSQRPQRLSRELAGSCPLAEPGLLRRLAAQGISYFAFVCHDGYHDRALLTHLLHEVKYPIVDMFDDVISAYEWLRRCPDLPRQ